MRTKRQNNSLVFKGLILVLAFALTLIYIPFGNIMAMVRAATTYTDYNYVTIGKNVDEVSTSVTKGQVYKIAAGYIGNDNGKSIGRIPVGTVLNTDGATLKTSTVTVKYSSKVIGQIKDETAVEDGDGNTKVTLSADAGYVGEFTPDKQGEYTIVYSYTYTKDSVDYTNSYEFIVTSTLTKANLNFEDNTTTLLPQHIDMKLAKVGESYKDMYLPLPEVTGEDGEAQVAGTDYEITTSTADPSSHTDKNYLVVTGRASGSAVVAISKNAETGALYVAGAELASKGAGEYTFTYQYYEKGQFVVSTTKTTELHAEGTPYYENYKLALKLASDFPQDAGQTGVEKSLPVAEGRTASTTTPADQAVDVHYSVKVLYKANASSSYAALNTTKYAEVLNADGTLKDPTVFKPLEDGSYTFIYTVTDYYGNTASSNSGTYHWENVEDIVKPTPVVYDAATYSETEGYVSTTEFIPTDVKTKDVIVYAIGMTDNSSKVGDEGVELARKVWLTAHTSELKQSEVEIAEYNEYNLIFAHEDVATLLANNYRLRLQLEAEGVSGDENVLAWLKAHKYLIVTNVEDDDHTVENGYAYIDSATTFGTEARNYQIQYTAKDASGNEGLTVKTLRVNSNLVETEGPKITFATTLDEKYLPTATVRFDAPTVQDDHRTSKVAEKVLYRLLNGTTPIDIADAKTAEFGGIEYVDITDNTADSYSIDLSKGEGATKVEILVYAYDDLGNLTTLTREAKVVSVTDTAAPILGDVEVGATECEAAATVVLPTVTVGDDQADYLTYNVNLTYTDSEGNVYESYAQGATGDKVVNVKTGAGRITVQAGSFVASQAGTYQASVAVKDYSNRAVVVFAHYTATSRGPSIQNPELSVSGLADNYTLDLAKETSITLPTPAVEKFELDNSVTYDELTDLSTEKYVVRGISKDGKAQGYKIEGTYGFERGGIFAPEISGSYELTYKLDVVVYEREKIEYVDVTADPTVDGDYYRVVGTDYRLSKAGNVYTITNGTAAFGTVSKDENGNVVKKDVDGHVVANFGVAALDAIDFYDAFNVYSLSSKTYSITVKADTSAPTIPEMPYDKAMTVEDFEDKGITFYGLEGLQGIKLADSYYKITWTLANGNGGSVEEQKGDAALEDYVLTKTKVGSKYDGTYTVKYHVVGKNGVSTDKEYSIVVGDNQKPVISIPEKYKSLSYEIGQTFTFDLADITATDAGSGIKDGTLAVKLVNSSTGKTVEMTNEGTKYTYVFDKEDSIGNYKVVLSVEDNVGNKKEDDTTITFSVSAKSTDTKPVYQIVGIILIVISVLVLVGVVVYFIVSKVKLDKELKKK